MTDGRSTYDEDRLPWLEAVDDEDGPRGLSAKKMLAALLVVLLAAAAVAGTMFTIGRSDGNGAAGPPELIRAEPGPIKVRPDDPGGLDVAGDSGTAFATGAGEDRDAAIDLDAVPETPIARPQPKPAEPEPKTIPPGETREPVAPDDPAPPMIGGAGGVIQLGFFDSAAQAEAAWTALSGRFSVVSAATKIVVPYRDGFRLRAGAASAAEAKRACQTLKVAGENCFVVR